jgi:hypothetical protein
MKINVVDISRVRGNYLIVLSIVTKSFFGKSRATLLPLMTGDAQELINIGTYESEDRKEVRAVVRNLIRVQDTLYREAEDRSMEKAKASMSLGMGYGMGHGKLSQAAQEEKHHMMMQMVTNKMVSPASLLGLVTHDVDDAMTKMGAARGF